MEQHTWRMQLDVMEERETPWMRTVLRALRGAASGVEVRLARLPDQMIPAILASVDGADGGRALRSFADSRPEARILWLNMASSLTGLLVRAQEGPCLRAACALLFHMAEMAASAQMPDAALREAYGRLERVLGLLLNDATRAAAN